MERLVHTIIITTVVTSFRMYFKTIGYRKDFPGREVFFSTLVTKKTLQYEKDMLSFELEKTNHGAFGGENRKRG